MTDTLLIISAFSMVLSLVALLFSYQVYRAYRSISLGWSMLFAVAFFIALHRTFAFMYETGAFQLSDETFRVISMLLFFASSAVICVGAYFLKEMTGSYKMFEWKAMKESLKQIRKFDEAGRKRK